jgi:hypothetical protein
MSATVGAAPPLASASAIAASFALGSSRAFQRSQIAYVAPGTSPTLLPICPASRAVAVTTRGLVEAGHEAQRRQRLERAGWEHLLVRVLRCEHLAGREVGQQPGVGVDLGQGFGARTQVHHDAGGRQVRTADGA